VSKAFSDLAEAPEALREARVAMAIGQGTTPHVVEYGDVPLQAMLVVAPKSAERLRRAVLGALLDAPDSAVLLEMLGAWIDSYGSASECAKPLFLHRNSVPRRLQRLQELTGCDPQTPRGIALLYVSLEAHRLGPSGLVVLRTYGRKDTRSVGAATGNAVEPGTRPSTLLNEQRFPWSAQRSVPQSS
jgi:DNA-binding PucR family transcriptional regulator